MGAMTRVPETVYPLLQVGVQELPLARLDVHGVAAPFVGAADASHGLLMMGAGVVEQTIAGSSKSSNANPARIFSVSNTAPFTIDTALLVFGVTCTLAVLEPSTGRSAADLRIFLVPPLAVLAIARETRMTRPRAKIRDDMILHPTISLPTQSGHARTHSRNYTSTH